MTDHTIEAHFEVKSEAKVQSIIPELGDEFDIILAMAKAIGGEGKAEHPIVIFEAVKIYRAVKAMFAAEAARGSKETG